MRVKKSRAEAVVHAVQDLDRVAQDMMADVRRQQKQRPTVEKQRSVRMRAVDADDADADGNLKYADVLEVGE